RSLEFPKIARAEALARAALEAPSLEAALPAVLGDHHKPHLPAVPSSSRFSREVIEELQALCVHLPFYGTVSATIVLFGPDGRVARYLFAPGPPCVTPFDDVTALLEG